MLNPTVVTPNDPVFALDVPPVEPVGGAAPPPGDGAAVVGAGVATGMGVGANLHVSAADPVKGSTVAASCEDDVVVLLGAKIISNTGKRQSKLATL